MEFQKTVRFGASSVVLVQLLMAPRFLLRYYSLSLSLRGFLPIHSLSMIGHSYVDDEQFPPGIHEAPPAPSPPQTLLPHLR